MGKGVLIFAILTIVVLSTIVLSVLQYSKDVPKLVSTEEQKGNASNLSDYALNFAMKQVVDKNITNDCTIPYNNFFVLDGKIDSLKYNFDFNGETNIIQLIANVTWVSNQETVHHQAEAHLKFIPGTSTDPFKTGFWHFNEGTGEQTEDFTENDNEAVAVNKATPGDDWEDDRFTNGGQSMHFDNSLTPTDEYFSVTEDSSLDFQEEGSCEAWIYLEYPLIPFGGIVHKGERADWFDEAYSLQFWSSGREICFAVRNSNNYVQKVIGPRNLEVNNWYYVVGTWNPSEVAVWVDGVKVASQRNIIGKVRNSNGNLQIGSQLSNGNTYHWYNSIFGFNGRIDDVAVRSNAYTANEIKMNYINSSMILYYKFDDGKKDATVTRVKDSSPNKIGGVLKDGYHTNGVTLPQWVDGKFGGGLKFNGYDNLVRVDSHPSLLLKESGAIAVWAKMSPGANGKPYLVHKNDSKQWKTASYGFGFKKLKGPYLRLWGKKKTYVNKNNRKLETERWYHLTGSWDADDVKVCIDGAEVDSQPNKSNPQRERDVPVIIGAGIDGLFNTTDGARTFDGIIDEVKIFFRKLSIDEVGILKNYDPITSPEVQDSYKIVYWQK